MVQDKKPWLNEPDYKRWRDGETQLQCLILRPGSMSALCGYVRLPRSLAKKMETRFLETGVPARDENSFLSMLMPFSSRAPKLFRMTERAFDGAG